MAEFSFPTRVVDPNGVIHSYHQLGENWISDCGQPCGKWSVMVGGDPDCPTCKEVANGQRPRTTVGGV